MRSLFCFLMLFLFLSPFEQSALLAQTPGEPSNIAVMPDSIRIDAFYKGMDVTVRADIPYACDGAAVKIQGDDEEVVLKRKGKVSIFWLNVDEVAISNAPGIYILNSSDSLESISSLDEQKTLMLGYEALRQRASIHCKNALSGSEFSEFVKLKEHNGSYQESATAQLLMETDKKRVFKAVLHIPPVMPSGDYRISLYYFKNLALMGELDTAFNVEQVGVPKYLYSLASGHPAAYGLLAIVIAMTTGIVMGVIFGSRARRK